jgi:hypothetical protein
VGLGGEKDVVHRNRTAAVTVNVGRIIPQSGSVCVKLDVDRLFLRENPAPKIKR